LSAKAAVIVLLLVLAVVGVSSSRQAAGDTSGPLMSGSMSTTVAFPLEDDIWELTYDREWRVVGDKVTGTREIGITKISIVDIDLRLSYNTASNKTDRQFVFEVSLNGISIGRFDVFGYNGLTINTGIAFQPIVTQGPVVIQYKLVDRDGGKIIMIADGTSTITLRDGLATKKEWANEALAKLNQLYYEVDQSGIDQGPKRSLLSKVDRAIAKVNQALVYIDKDNNEKANNKLRIALKAVESFSQRIPPSYEYLHSYAEEIIVLIETAIRTPI